MCQPVIEHVNIAKRTVKILREEGVVEFAKRFLRYMKNQSRILFFPYALFKIRSFRCDYELNKLIGFAFDGLGGLIKPMQIRDELIELLEKLKGEKPKVVLEIGTANGGTLFMFSRIASEDATIISIDLPRGRFGGGYPKWKIPLYKSFARKKQEMHLIRANSHSNATLEKVKTLLNDKYVDFLYIDGDHSYYGVKKDFEVYSSLVKKGGIIVFHDIAVHPAKTDFEVSKFGMSKFWREIRDNYESEEIVKDKGQNRVGIGIIYV